MWVCVCVRLWWSMAKWNSTMYPVAMIYCASKLFAIWHWHDSHGMSRDRCHFYRIYFWVNIRGKLKALRRHIKIEFEILISH